MWLTWLSGLVVTVLLQVVTGEQHPEDHTLTAYNSSFFEEPPRRSCESARLKCAYRLGCGQALQDYMMSCSFILDGGTNRLNYCPQQCQQTLIALTSTEEGKNLMDCQCYDEQCKEQKRRVEVCRPLVEEAIRNSSVVSCRVAEWICRADSLCSTALQYYDMYCKAMIKGKKCNHRCNNSLSILMRQLKAAKLANCVCDGREDYDCISVRENISRLCLHKLPTTALPPPSIDTNEVFSGAYTSSVSCWTTAAVVVLGWILSLVARDT